MVLNPLRLSPFPVFRSVLLDTELIVTCMVEVNHKQGQAEGFVMSKTLR